MTKENYTNKIVICFIFVFFFAMYHYNTIYLYPLTSSNGNLIFDADIYALEGTKELTLHSRGMERHLLFSPIANATFKLVKKLYPTALIKKLNSPFVSSDNLTLSDAYSVCFVMTLFAMLNLVMTFYILSFSLERRNAFLFTVLYGFSFANVVFFSISETYVLSDSVLLLYSFSLIYLAKKKDTKNEQIKKNNYLLPAFLNGIATLFNPPLVVLLLPTCYASYRLQHDKFSFLKALLTVLYNVFIVVVIFVVFYISVYGVKFCGIFMDNYNAYGTLSNFLLIKNFVRVFVAFIFFSIITPINKIAAEIDYNIFFGYLDSFHRVTLLLFYSCYLLVVFKYIIKQKDMLVNTFLLFVLSIQTFYLYLSPNKLMLYSSQVVFPLVFIFAYIFEKIKHKHKYFLLSFFLFLLAFNNASSIYIYSPAIENINKILSISIFK